MGLLPTAFHNLYRRKAQGLCKTLDAFARVVVAWTNLSAIRLLRARLRHSDDDISLLVSSFDIAMSFGNLLQRVAPIDDGS